MSSLEGRWPAFLELLRAEGSTAPMFELLARVADEAIGSKLATATVFDLPNGRLRRIYSQNETAYPVGGFKPIPANKWTDTIVGRRELYTALTIEANAEDFFDWELIRSLGCESIANQWARGLAGARRTYRWQAPMSRDRVDTRPAWGLVCRSPRTGGGVPMTVILRTALRRAAA